MADIDYEEWKAQREKERQHNIRLMFQDLPACRKCNDHGYVTIQYPLHYETIKPCDCAIGHKRWGENVYRDMDSRDEKTWWLDMQLYFGGKNKAETAEIMKQYELREKKQRSPKSERVFVWCKKG